ncbi:MAG: STAS domain-containing protein, partial [Ilumatobacteraceae bacterium]
TLDFSRRGELRILTLVGELDIATRDRVRDACTSDGSTDLLVEMADITFMDCAGYGALVSARRSLQHGGHTLTLHNTSGQPADLLAMLTLLEART